MKQKTQAERKLQNDFLYDDIDEDTLLEIDNDIQNKGDDDEDGEE